MTDVEVSTSRLQGMLGAQHLTSIMNDPNDAGSLAALWPFGGALAAAMGMSTEETPIVPPLAPGVLPEVFPSDFERYLRALQGTYPRFVASRESFVQQSSRVGIPMTCAPSYRFSQAPRSAIHGLALMVLESCPTSQPRSDASIPYGRSTLWRTTGDDFGERSSCTWRCTGSGESRPGRSGQLFLQAAGSCMPGLLSDPLRQVIRGVRAKSC